MARHMGKFHVTGALLRTALAMPDLTNIYNIVRHEFLPDEFVLYVEHPDLPELSEGESPPMLYPTIVVDHDKRPEMWATFDWGIE